MTRLAHSLPVMMAFCLGILPFRHLPAQAQIRARAATPSAGIIGLVVDQQSRLPIGAAYVTLLGTRLRTATDSGGRFTHAGLGSGTYLLEVRAIGYSVTSWVLRLRDGEVLDHVFELAPTGFELDPILVEARPGYAERRLHEFEERRRSGRGVYITEEKIRASHAATMADLLRGVPGVRLNCRSGVCTAQMTRGARGICAADWVVDGMPATMSGSPHLPTVGIVAVEIYRSPGEAPGEFLKADSQCGVIVIWTKSGP